MQIIKQLQLWKNYMKKINTLELYKKFIKEDVNEHPKILVHACCAPCSSEVINELYKHGDITIYYYNPNIYPFNEYQKRWEQFSLLPFDFEKINGEYDESIYLEVFVVTNAMIFELKKRQDTQKKMDMIILPQPYR